jgi:hypothetical protein
MDPTMSATRYLSAAHYVAQTIPGILVQLGLKPLINRFVLTETERGDAWLFVVLEDDHLPSQEDYASSEVLNYLSTAFQGLPVVFSNTYGLRYAVLLSSPLWQDPNLI